MLVIDDVIVKEEEGVLLLLLWYSFGFIIGSFGGVGMFDKEDFMFLV